MKRVDSSIIRVPKPVIKITRKSAGSESTRAVLFIKVVSWAKENAENVDLMKARDRAGASFRGTLAQHFVLLD